ncbi:MAG: hypothetical protein QXZ43_01345 [Candidatus Aenigmatarchaeota archaeon]
MKKYLIFLIFLLLPIVYSLNFGSFVKNDFAEIKGNETAIFEIILWSSDSNSSIILHEKNIPENIKIKIDPIIVDRKREDIYISIGNTLIKANRVKIFVDASEAKPGYYDFSISALAYNPEENINVVQEREFNFKIKVIGDYKESNSTSIKNEQNEKFSKDLEKESVINYNKIIILSVIILTIIIVILIIKK